MAANPTSASERASVPGGAADGGEAPAPSLVFHLGVAGAVLPIVVFLAGTAWLGFSGAPDERGLWPILVAAMGAGLILAKRPTEYAAAFIRGMARPLVMQMVLSWLLAGVLSALLREAGLVHALVQAGGALGASGGSFVLLVLLVSAFFSTATGTSLGTILVCAPLLYPAAGLLEANPVAVIGAVLAGATFGDNVSPVSDTTIASAGSQGAPMGGVVRSRLRYALPAALIAAVVLTAFGGTGMEAAARSGDARIAGAAHPANLSGDWIALPILLAPLAAFVMLWRGRGLVESLFAGVAVAAAVALGLGLLGPADLLRVDATAYRATGLVLDGMESAVGIVVFTLLLMGIVGPVEEAGALRRLTRRRLPAASAGRPSGADSTASAARRAELRIVGLASAAVLLTTHTVVAILAVGGVAKETGRRAGIDRYRRANLLDVTVCTYPFLLPFFIPTILAASATGSGEPFGVPRVPAFQAGIANAYSWALLGVILIAVATGWGRAARAKESVADAEVHLPESASAPSPRAVTRVSRTQRER